MTGARTGRRVVVTGIGVVAPCGIGVDAFWDGLLAPPPIGRLREIAGWDPSPWFGSPKDARRADRFQQIALAAAAEALSTSGDPSGDPGRKGVVIATGVGGLHAIEDQVAVRLERGDRRVSPFLVPMMMANSGSAAVSMRYGWQGPCETITTACAASNHGIGYAANLIRWGKVDAMLAGGAESPVTATAIAGFSNMTAMTSSGISRPFDVDRDGFVLAEAAAVLLLEELEAARGRGATILGEIMGAASTADAFHVTAPSPGGAGAVRCIEVALADAGLGPGDIAHVNAHGTSTPLNDSAEAEAITKVFGAPGPPVTSIKGVTGHSLGAAGAVETASVLISMARRQLPPTAGTTTLDPAMSIDLVLDGPRDWEPGPTISNNFGFGGHNGTLVIGPPPV
jgi:3-oxoacyl-[acyl-carrier-protein] synthase II